MAQIETKKRSPDASFTMNQAVALIDYENAVRERSVFSHHNRLIAIVWIIFSQLGLVFWFAYKIWIHADTLNPQLLTVSAAERVRVSIYASPFLLFSIIHALIWHFTQRRMRLQIENFRKLFGHIRRSKYDQPEPDDARFTDELIKVRYENRALYLRGSLLFRDELEPFLYLFFQLYVIVFWVMALFVFK